AGGPDDLVRHPGRGRRDARVPPRRRRRARRLRRGCRHRRRARGDRRRPLCGRRLRAQADGRARPDHEAITVAATIIDGKAVAALIEPGKDVDGLTPQSAGALAQGRPGLRPCTPSGVIELLDAYDIPLEGAEAVVVGRSLLVGRPLVFLLLERNATVTVCHSRTRNLPDVCARADVLVAAVGSPRL